MLEGGACTWFDTPPKPGSGGRARRAAAGRAPTERSVADSADGQVIEEWARDLAGEISYGPHELRRRRSRRSPRCALVAGCGG